MENSKIQSLSIMFAIMLSMSVSTLSAGPKDVKGFPGIPIYPGVETFLDKEYSGSTDEEGHPWVWYEFKSQKLKDEWDKDAVGVYKKIVSFYQTELKKLGWQYIGEGVGNHHWIKGKEAIAIGSAADYIIAYIRMSNEDAKANFAELTDKEFIKAYVDCAKSAQKVYEKNGMKTMENYMKQISSKRPEEVQKFEDELRSEVRKTVKDVLKSFKISLGRFKELKSEYEELVQQYIGKHVSEFQVNQLGFMAMEEITR